MGDIIGIFKELREGEKVNLDSEAVLPIVLVKEVDTKGLIRKSQKEVPTALMFANLYVTSQRLLFLVYHQTQAEDTRKGNIPVRLSEMTPKWFAIPMESIREIEVRNLESRDSKDLRQFLQRAGEPSMVDRAGVQLVYGGRELTEEDREFSQSLLRMGAMQRMTTKAEGISDKLFIGTERASLLASTVQGAMGLKDSPDSATAPATQQFSVLETGAQPGAPGGEQEEVESQPDAGADDQPPEGEAQS